MKTATIFATIASLAAFASAQDASAADVAIVRQALEAVVEDVTALDAGVTAFSGIADAATLQAQSQAVIDSLTQGTANVEPVQGSISIAQASTELLPGVQGLNSITDTVVSNVISKKQVFVDACVGTVILDQLNQQLTAATTFRSTIATKFSSDNQGLVNDLSQPAITSLQRAVDEFADQTSLPASCSSGGGSEGGEETATTTTSAAAETTPAPVETTPAPVETTPAPVETTPAPVETTPAPVETTPAPVETTPAPVECESAPAYETPAPVETATADCPTFHTTVTTLTIVIPGPGPTPAKQYGRPFGRPWGNKGY